MTLEIERRPPSPAALPPEASVTRLSEILRRWRAAERALDEAGDRPDEAGRLASEIAGWRSAYQRIEMMLRQRDRRIEADR